MISGNRDTCWVNLCVTRVCKICPSTVCSPCSHYVTSHCISRQKEYIPVSSGSQYYCMSRVTLDFSCHHISGNDSTSFPIYQNHIHHFMTVKCLYLTTVDLAIHC